MTVYTKSMEKEPQTLELTEFLEMKYAERLKIYAGIKSEEKWNDENYPDTEWNPPRYVIFRKTFAAERLRILRGAIIFLNGETPTFIQKDEVIKELWKEHEILVRMGERFKESTLFYSQTIKKINDFT